MLIGRIKNRFKKSLLGQGFTLIEIMVAVMLLLFAMAGIVPFFLGGLTQASTVRYKSIATNVARERLEEIRQLDYREIATPASLTQRFGGTSTTRGVTFDVTYDVAESTYQEGTLKKVTVNVGWTAPPKLSTASITTLIHQQFLGPRGAFLELTPTSADPLGTPFPAITGSRPTPRTTTVRYHIAQADWALVFNDLDLPTMAVRNVYMRLVFFDDNGVAVAFGDSANDFKINNSYVRYSVANGKVNDVWFEYNFDANGIPDGYWELQAIVYNQYDEPGNVWRQRVRVEMGPPAAPTAFVAAPQADNQTVVLTWTGGLERDRAYYVIERRHWDGTMWPASWTTVAPNLDPKASTFTDQGSVGTMLDPWGDGLNQNLYQYRIRAVDICQPGLVGPATQADATLPDAAAPTTTSTTVGPTTTSTSTATTLASYSVQVKNNVNKTWAITIRNGANAAVHSGSVSPNATLTATGLAAGNFSIRATTSGRADVTTSFSLAAQNGQIVMTIW